jgi:altronate dehydratase small subunit
MNMDIIIINDIDNVATALRDIKKGEQLEMVAGGEVLSVITGEAIESGHKLAVRSINKGGSVIKYGEVIGVATKNIKTGEHVHIHNVAGRRGRGDIQ